MPNYLEEALNSVGASALIQKEIDPVLLEYQRRYAPLVRTLASEKWGSTVYFFNQRTLNPAGGFVSDGGSPRPVTTSTYVQNQYTIRNLQSVGSVTGYAQAVTADLIGNLRAREIMGAARGLYWDIETAILWGNSGSTIAGPYPQFDGLDTIASTYSGDGTNAINFNGGNFSLGALDQLIDLVETNVAEPVESSEWFFLVSPTANSRLSQLFTNQQRFVDEVEVATGLIVPSYRNIPIVKTSFLSPASYAMGTVTASANNSTGSLAAATYYYRVDAIMSRFGAILASVECSATTSGGTSEVTLSFTPPTAKEAAVPLTYRVYRSTSTGAETLLGYVDANVVASSDGTSLTVTNQIVDNGVTLLAQNSTGPTQQASAPATYVNGNTNVSPALTGGQNVYLLSRDPNYIIRPYVREMTPVELYPTTGAPDTLPFAFVTDTTLAVRAPKYIGRLANAVVVLSN